VNPNRLAIRQPSSSEVPMQLIGLAVVLAVSLTLAPLVLAAPTDAAEPYTEEAISFPSGSVTLRAVLARPYGDGPFAAYVHVHGSVTTYVASNPPWNGLDEGSYLQILARAGYVVLRLARRGHFGSEGTTYNYSATHGGQSAYAVYSSIQTDATDLLAAVEYLRTRSFVDPDRVAVGGNSVGGIVSVLAGARDPKLRAVISLAGGFAWGDRGVASTPFVDSAWKESARTMTAPVLILWSKNDTNLDVDVGRDLEKRLRAAGKRVEVIVYPPYSQNGHFMFYRADGTSVFSADLLRFLNDNTARKP
jgi:dienelactone hydrolase